MLRSFSMACAFVVLILTSGTASAQRGDSVRPIRPDKASSDQQWSVTFAEDSALFRASEATDVKFIQATIKALQQHGIEKFALRAQKTTAVPGDDRSITVRLRNGEAELSASVDLPYKYVAGMISMLAQRGVEKIKFSAPTSHLDSLERRTH